MEGMNQTNEPNVNQLLTIASNLKANNKPEIPAAVQLKSQIAEQGTNALQVWMKHFDTNNDDKITLDEFTEGMRTMKFKGDVMKLWYELDADGSGEITLQEIDAESNSLWQSFRSWCATRFTSNVSYVSRSCSGTRSSSACISEIAMRGAA